MKVLIVVLIVMIVTLVRFSDQLRTNCVRSVFKRTIYYMRSTELNIFIIITWNVERREWRWGWGWG